MRYFHIRKPYECTFKRILEHLNNPRILHKIKNNLRRHVRSVCEVSHVCKHVGHKYSSQHMILIQTSMILEQEL